MKTGQRDSVCRKKDEYGDMVAKQSAGLVKTDSVFAPIVMSVFFFVLLVLFCGRPIFRCVRTCCHGPSKSAVAENVLVQQSSPIVAGAITNNSGEKEELRKSAQAALAAYPQPDAPDSSPQELLPADDSQDAMPSEVLSALTQPPSHDLPPLADLSQPSQDDGSISEGASPQAKKWSRPTGRKKRGTKDLPEEERPPPPSTMDPGAVGRGPNIAPTSAANVPGLLF